MASDARYNESDFNVWPDSHQSGMYPDLDFIDSVPQDPYTDFSVQSSYMNTPQQPQPQVPYNPYVWNVGHGWFGLAE